MPCPPPLLPPPSDDDDPRRIISAWLPHLLLLALLIAALWLVAQVLAPLWVPLLLAAATAVLTGPVLYRPMLRWSTRLLPGCPPPWHRQIAAVLTTALFVALIASPFLLLALGVLRNLEDGWQLLLGIALQDDDRLVPFLTGIETQIGALADLYPRLHLDPQTIRMEVRDLLTTTNRIGPVLFALYAGSGRIAELILSLACLGFLYVHGPGLIRAVLAWTPLNAGQQQALINRHDRVAQHLLVGSLGTACLKGLFFGLLAWLAGIPVPAPLIVLLATVLSLLPMIGLTMIWLPLSLLAYSQGAPWTAGAIAVLSIVAGFGFSFLRQRFQRSRGLADDRWIDFALFLGLVGGLLSFGPPGLVIGPVMVAIVTVFGRYGLPLYQGDLSDEEDGDTPSDPDGADATASE